MKTVTIVSTQLQLINAVERIKKANSINNTLIVDCVSLSRAEQLEKILNLSLYKSVFKQTYSTSITNHRNVYIDMVYAKMLMFALVLLNRYSLIILGNYNLLKHKYLMKIGTLFNKDARTVVVDDGTISLFYPEIRERERSLRSGDKSFDKSKASLLVFYNSFRRCAFSKIEFFTLYGLKFSTPDVVTENTFSFLATKKNAIPGFDGLESFSKVIVGQPLIQLGLVSENDYCDAILKAVGECGMNKVLYVSHPAEDQYPFTSMGIKIVKFLLPFECMVKLMNPLVEIYGFASSALLNAKMLVPFAKVKAMDLTNALRSESEFAKVSSKIYSEFKKSGIELISIK